MPISQDEEKHRRLKTIMSDRPDLINSELGGMAVSGTTQCFKALYLQRMFSPSDAAILTFEQDFFVSVDPMAGGEKSDFAVVSFAVHRGVYQVRFIRCQCLLLARLQNAFFFDMHHAICMAILHRDPTPGFIGVDSRRLIQASVFTSH